MGGLGGVVEMGGRWGGLGVRLGWGEKAENLNNNKIKEKTKK